MSRAFVTGATGMVGGALVHRLLRDGVDVVVLVMDPDPQSELYRSGAVAVTTVVAGRLEELDTVERAIAVYEPDTVFHLGAQTIVGAARRAPLLTLESNVRGTWNVLEACRRHPTVVSRIVVASSDKAYGVSDSLPYREDMPLAGLEPYEVSKAAADLITQAYASSYELPAVIARCGNIYGPGDLNWSRIVPGTIRSLLRGEQPLIRSDGTLVRDYLHVDDVVDAYLALADGIGTGVLAPGDALNFSDEAPLAALELYEAICKAAGFPGTDPRILGDAPGELQEQWLSAELARTRLGWAARVGLDDGLARTVDWYRNFLAAVTGTGGAVPGSNDKADELRREIAALVTRYHEVAFAPRPFVPGVSPVPVSGKVFDDEELRLLVDASLDFWLTTGRFAAEFEERFARVMGAGSPRLCNSGSSANLLSISALTSPLLGDRALQPGDEVITCASGFPTTVNPIYQNGLVPVFVDVDLDTYNVDPSRLAEAVGSRTRAVALAHTLGNPFDVAAVQALCEQHDLWLVEDTCDAVGATYAGRPVGSFGQLATVSFYPAHHVTMGEGGCVLINDPKLERIVESFRDWGRDCWCAPGEQNTCGRRFGWQLGELPYGYDHKYVYSHLGYNLKLTDMQAAVGVAQLDKLGGFVDARRRNWQYLHEGLADVGELRLAEPTPNSEPSWFGFPLAVRPEAGFDRYDLVEHLEGQNIATRLIFGGNLVRQPAYLGLPSRIVGSLEHADLVARSALWIGCYPGLTTEMLDSVIASIRTFVAAPVHARRRGNAG